MTLKHWTALTLISICFLGLSISSLFARPAGQQKTERQRNAEMYIPLFEGFFHPVGQRFTGFNSFVEAMYRLNIHDFGTIQQAFADLYLTRSDLQQLAAEGESYRQRYWTNVVHDIFAEGGRRQGYILDTMENMLDQLQRFQNKKLGARSMKRGPISRQSKW